MEPLLLLSLFSVVAGVHLQMFHHHHPNPHFENGNVRPAGYPCNIPLNTGHCPMRIIRWFYNPISGRCQQFVYSGCGGNDNNFLSEEHCDTACRTDSYSEPHPDSHDNKGNAPAAAPLMGERLSHGEDKRRQWRPNEEPIVPRQFLRQHVISTGVPDISIPTASSKPPQYGIFDNHFGRRDDIIKNELNEEPNREQLSETREVVTTPRTHVPPVQAAQRHQNPNKPIREPARGDSQVLPTIKSRKRKKGFTFMQIFVQRPQRQRMMPFHHIVHHKIHHHLPIPYPRRPSGRRWGMLPSHQEHPDAQTNVEAEQPYENNVKHIEMESKDSDAPITHKHAIVTTESKPTTTVPDLTEETTTKPKSTTTKSQIITEKHIKVEFKPNTAEGILSGPSVSAIFKGPIFPAKWHDEMQYITIIIVMCVVGITVIVLSSLTVMFLFRKLRQNKTKKEEVIEAVVRAQLYQDLPKLAGNPESNV